MMKDAHYFRIVRLITWFHKKATLLGSENLPAQGPAVFIANHMGPEGPINAICSIPLRLYPWIAADMVDKQRAAEYLRVDFVEPTLKLKLPISKVVAKGISFISVSLLSSIGCIPVNRHDYQEIQDTLDKCISLLMTGQIVLVFPEESTGELDPLTKTRPFLKGFTRMGAIYYEKTGEILRFFPVANHESRQIMIGKPINFDPVNPPGIEGRRLKRTLSEQIRSMIIEMENGCASSG